MSGLLKVCTLYGPEYADAKYPTFREFNVELRVS